jgi:hypothetical protein
VAEDLEPSAAWRAAGMRFLADAEAALWSAAGERARAYLHARGLNDETLRVWRIGFQPEEGRRDPAERWGFPARNPTPLRIGLCSALPRPAGYPCRRAGVPQHPAPRWSPSRSGYTVPRALAVLSDT